MRIVWLWPTKLVVGNRTKLVVLQEAAAAIVAHQDVELAIRTEAQNASVMITAKRLICISLKSPQPDEIAIKD